MTKWWGQPWPRSDFRAAVCSDDADHGETPVGEPCARCQVPITADDQGVTIPYFGPEGEGVVHYTMACFIRGVVPEPLATEILSKGQLRD